jgi:hypothetical protein
MPRVGIGLRPPTALVPRGGHIFLMRPRSFSYMEHRQPLVVALILCLSPAHHRGVCT